MSDPILTVEGLKAYYRVGQFGTPRQLDRIVDLYTLQHYPEGYLVTLRGTPNEDLWHGWIRERQAADPEGRGSGGNAE